MSKGKVQFLELSESSLNNLESLDFDNLLTVWTTLTKSSHFIKNGKRLENISWRVVNRNILLQHQSKLDSQDFNTLVTISRNKSYKQPFLADVPKKKKHQQQQQQQQQPQQHTQHQINQMVSPKVLQPGQLKSPQLRQHTQQQQQQSHNHHQQQQQQPMRPTLERNNTSTSVVHGFSPKKNGMFYIESSPSPAEHDLVDSIDKLTLDKAPQQQKQHQLHQHIQQQQQQHQPLFQKPTSPGSEIQSNQSLFGNNNDSKAKVMFSSDEEFSDGSDWSSLSEEEYDDSDEEGTNQSKLEFEKTKREEPKIRRSLLSGLFLNRMDSSQPQTQTQTQTQPKEPKESQQPNRDLQGEKELPHGPELPRKLFSEDRTHTESHSNALEITSHRVTTTSSSHVTASGTPVMPSISKSAINLASFFANSRRPHLPDSTKHQSNAPPTASTLLPTALSTHMFLPTQQHHNQKAAAAIAQRRMIKSPKQMPQQEAASIAKDIDSGVNLSPRTQRRQMLSTELSESLRKSLVWERSMMVRGGGVTDENKPRTRINSKERRSNGRKEKEPQKPHIVEEDKNNMIVNGVLGRQKMLDLDAISANVPKKSGIHFVDVEVPIKDGDEDWDNDNYHAKGW